MARGSRCSRGQLSGRAGDGHGGGGQGHGLAVFLSAEVLEGVVGGDLGQPRGDVAVEAPVEKLAVQGDDGALCGSIRINVKEAENKFRSW